MAKLTFEDFRKANMTRQPVFRNRRGGLSQCENWTWSDWAVAIMGEFGEFCNELKKHNRGDYDDEPLGDAELLDKEVLEKMHNELADTFSYLDILAAKLGFTEVHLVKKWNEISERIGYEGRLYLEDETVHKAEDGSIRQDHYGSGHQPWDDIKDQGWAPEFAAGNILKYLRRSKNEEHSLKSARWYWAQLQAISSTNAANIRTKLTELLTDEEMESLIF
jgi:hypothetical protein